VQPIGPVSSRLLRSPWLCLSTNHNTINHIGSTTSWIRACAHLKQSDVSKRLKLSPFTVLPPQNTHGASQLYNGDVTCSSRVEILELLDVFATHDWWGETVRLSLRHSGPGDSGRPLVSTLWRWSFCTVTSFISTTIDTYWEWNQTRISNLYFTNKLSPDSTYTREVRSVCDSWFSCIQITAVELVAELRVNLTR